MELKEFVKNVLIDIDSAVDEARSLMSRDIYFANTNTSRTIEFDIAVSAEEKEGASGKAGVKVLHFVEAGGDINKESANSTVSRIVFGINIQSATKAENA